MIYKEVNAIYRRMVLNRKRGYYIKFGGFGSRGVLYIVGGII